MVLTGMAEVPCCMKSAFGIQINLFETHGFAFVGLISLFVYLQQILTRLKG